MVSAKQGVFAVLILYFAYWYISSPTFHPDLVKNKVVVICGASQGIGEQLAYKYASYGCRLILASRQLGKLEKVKKRCLELGSPETHVIVSDFSRYEDSFNLHKETLRLVEKIDILILNHAIGALPYWKKDPLSKEAVIDIVYVNYISYVVLATLFEPQLVESGGSIGVVSSVLGVHSAPGGRAYSGTKHALHGFFGSYRLDLVTKHVSNVSITLCVLGPASTEILTQDLLPNSTHVIGVVPLENPKDHAEGIIQGVALRKRIVYVPRLMALFHYADVLFGDCPWEYLIRYANLTLFS